MLNSTLINVNYVTDDLWTLEILLIYRLAFPDFATFSLCVSWWKRTTLYIIEWENFRLITRCSTIFFLRTCVCVEKATFVSSVENGTKNDAVRCFRLDFRCILVEFSSIIFHTVTYNMMFIRIYSCHVGVIGLTVEIRTSWWAALMFYHLLLDLTPISDLYQ